MSILFAAWLGLAATLGALAVDTASLYLERRQMQSAVDLASIAAARNPAQAYEIARQTLEEAGLLLDGELAAGGETDERKQLAVEPGHYEANLTLPVGQRFVAGQEPFNAVRVRYRHVGHVYFSQAAGAPRVSASAVAVVTPRVAFSVGSRMARLDGGVVNAALNQLLGTGLSLSLADYRALASADLHLLDTLDSVGTEIGINALTYDDILNASASRGQVARAVARLLSSTPGFLASLIGNGAPSQPRVPVHRLISLGDLGGLRVGSRPQGIDAGVSALDLLVANASTGGTSQVSLGVAANVPGLVGINATLAVGEPLQFASFAVGAPGSVARTKQVRLRLRVSLLGTPLLLGAGVTLPIYVEIAYAEARVTAASCPTPSSPNGSATISTLPGLARLTVGETPASTFSSFGQPLTYSDATLVDALLIGVTGSARTEATAPVAIALEFDSDDIAAGTTRTAKTTGMVGSLTGSLLATLKIKVRPLGLSAPTIAGALATLLAPVTPVLDQTLDSLLDALGLSLGEADVRVYGVTCTHPVLVG